MSALTLYLAKLIGAVLLTMALVIAARGRDIAAIAERFMSDPALLFLAGAIRLIIGLALVLGHDDWSSGLAIAVSLVGWAALSSGLLLMFSPQERLLATYRSMRFKEKRVLYALGMGAFGAYLMLGGYLG